MKKECVAMLLAGGQGSRLYVLTGSMAVVAVATLAAYWASTAICVKRVMRRSVPLENMFPSFGGRA